MKRIIAIITVFAFAMVLAGMVYAQADTRSAAEKLAAGRAYLKLLDQKIIRLRNQGKTALVNQMQADKKSTITRMQAWKAEAEAEATAPPPPSTPVAPTPPPAPVARPAAPSAGMFGMGINTGYSVGYLAGSSVIVGRGDIILADPLGVGPMIGLSEDSIAWKVGLGGAMASKDVNDNECKAIPLFADGIVNLPADMMGGIDSYIGAGVNYVLYGSGKEAGSYGGQIYYGVKGDIGLGGNSYAELAYSIIRSGADVTSPYSMKGIGINIGTELML